MDVEIDEPPAFALRQSPLTYPPTRPAAATERDVTDLVLHRRAEGAPLDTVLDEVRRTVSTDEALLARASWRAISAYYDAVE
jgi:hypothetical protein